MDSKNILQSKTLWINVALGILSLVQNVVPPEYEALIIVVINILNRFATSKPVTLLPQ